jgi:hypothetical protein
MIVILIVGAVIAITFNIWNRKNPVGGSKKKSSSTVLTDEEQRHQNQLKRAFNGSNDMK